MKEKFANFRGMKDEIIKLARGVAEYAHPDTRGLVESATIVAIKEAVELRNTEILEKIKSMYVSDGSPSFRIAHNTALDVITKFIKVY